MPGRPADQSFRHVAAGLRLFYGADSLRALGPELARLGAERAVIVCGRSLAGDGTSIARVRAHAGERCAGVFTGVAAHSPIPHVQDAARELARLRADAVIAVGGGSAIVTARAASILLAEQRDIESLCTRRSSTGEMLSPKLQAPKLPQLVVPTTPTTAMVKAGSAVLDPARNSRVALFDPKTRAHVLFVDPQLLATAPTSLVVSASLNALCMAVEGLLSHTANALSDAHLLHACKLVLEHLPEAVATAPPDAAALGELVFASILSGQGTDQSGVGLAIPLAHAISARFHLDGGLINAILLPHVLRFNAAAVPQRMRRVAEVLAPTAEGASSAEDAARAVDALLRRRRLPTRLRELEVPPDVLADLAAVAVEDWFIRDNPRPVQGAEELRELLLQAW